MAVGAALAVQVLAGNPIKNVQGEATYFGDRNDSPADCRQKAAQMARIDALKREFGTVVSQVSMQAESERGDNAESRFLSLSESEVMGEWVSDVGEPKYKLDFADDGNLMVKCTIKGQARALSNEAPNFEALVLRNGVSRKNASTDFVDKDDLFLYFNAPTDGYVSVFLEDEDHNVFCLLPYKRSLNNETKVKRGKDYVFFHPESAGTERNIVDETTLTASNGLEYNKLYVVFSPNQFSKAPVKDVGASVPMMMESEEFSNWLVKNRRNDPKMGVKSMMLTIAPSNKKTEILKH